MATSDKNLKKEKKSHWSCEKEPETPYKAQHHRYYLHKNIMLILILCPIYNSKYKTFERSVTNQLDAAVPSTD